MKFGLGTYKHEDDVVEVNIEGNAEVAAEAQEAVEDLKGLEEVSQATQEYVEAGTDLGEVEAAAEEKVEEITDENAAEENIKLEADVNAILSRIGGSFRSSKFSGSLVSSKTESDFKLKGKAGYRARVEGISEVGKKVWENIKAFFAKIWDFMKSLFERFTALFKSNKSVLEGLKKKLEGEEDSKYSRLKDKAEISQPLAYFTEVKGSDIVKIATTVTGDYTNVFAKLISVAAKAASEGAGDGKGDQVLASKAEPNFSLEVLSKSFSASELEGAKNKKGEYSGYGVTGEGIAAFKLNNEKQIVQHDSFKIKGSKAFDKSSSKRDMLIDICETGIELCNELTSKFIKDAEKDFNEIKKETEDSINEIYSKDDKAKATDERKQFQRAFRSLSTSSASVFSKMIAVVGQQPSMAVKAVRNGMSICVASDK